MLSDEIELPCAVSNGTEHNCCCGRNAFGSEGSGNPLSEASYFVNGMQVKYVVSTARSCYGQFLSIGHQISIVFQPETVAEIGRRGSLTSWEVWRTSRSVSSSLQRFKTARNCRWPAQRMLLMSRVDQQVGSSAQQALLALSSSWIDNFFLTPQKDRFICWALTYIEWCL